jgi:hypothetical protein
MLPAVQWQVRFVVAGTRGSAQPGVVHVSHDYGVTRQMGAMTAPA